MTAITFVSARVHFSLQGRPQVFILGDSNIGNYRLAQGERLQDALEKKDPGVKTVNWAEPGAMPLDFYLQYCRGSLLAGRPQVAAVALAPDKFLWRASPHRLDADGANLRWIPWKREGMSLWKRLSSHERNLALVQLTNLLFFALADAAQELWIRFVQWPHERERMLSATRERRLRIEAKTRERAQSEENETVPNDAEFANLQLAQDARFLLSALRADSIEVRVLLLPYGNPGLLAQFFSSAVLAKHDTVLVRMRHWLESESVIYVDFNAPGEAVHFPAAYWDDLDHMKDPKAFSYMADRLRQSLSLSPALHTRVP